MLTNRSVLSVTTLPLGLFHFVSRCKIASRRSIQRVNDRISPVPRSSGAPSTHNLIEAQFWILTISRSRKIPLCAS